MQVWQSKSYGARGGLCAGSHSPSRWIQAPVFHLPGSRQDSLSSSADERGVRFCLVRGRSISGLYYALSINNNDDGCWLWQFSSS